MLDITLNGKILTDSGDIIWCNQIRIFILVRIVFSSWASFSWNPSSFSFSHSITRMKIAFVSWLPVWPSNTSRSPSTIISTIVWHTNISNWAWSISSDNVGSLILYSLMMDSLYATKCMSKNNRIFNYPINGAKRNSRFAQCYTYKTKRNFHFSANSFWLLWLKILN